MPASLGTRPVVVSPHLDDGVLSLGATIAANAERGVQVRVLTVFGNDPASTAPARPWDRSCGFGTEGEAASARRDEDREACGLVGAVPEWLSFGDSEYAADRSETAVWEALAPLLADADSVLVPGFPLAHPDHLWLTNLALARLAPAQRVGLYVEQPYAAWRLIGRGRREWAQEGLTLRRGLLNAAAIALHTPGGRALQRPHVPESIAPAAPAPDWTATRPGARAGRRKRRAVAAYRSQLAGFGRRSADVIALYEFGWGGEGLAWQQRG